MAVTGHNGNNETLIGMSYSSGFSLYDENAKEIKIIQSKTPIDMIIQRDTNAKNSAFQYVNATNIGFLTGKYYLLNGFKIKMMNASLHVELKPLNVDVAYAFVFKLGYMPIVNSTYADYTSFKLFCPSEIIRQSWSNETFYLFFQNQTQINGYQGFAGYGIRELNPNETSLYCSNNTSSQVTLPLIQSQFNFTSDFRIRTYTTGCYFYDTSSGKWSSKDMQLLNDTDTRQTHCTSSHLTSFAGGLLFIPTDINYQYVFANASFSRDYIVFSTLILFVVAYILFAVWAAIMDKRDLSKVKIKLLKDNCTNDKYFYELMVFTGDHSEAGTHSLVIIFLSNEIFLFN